MINEGIENLTNAIVLQAVKDYRKALKGLSLNGKSSLLLSLTVRDSFVQNGTDNSQM